MQSSILWIFGLILALAVIAVLIIVVVHLARKKSARNQIGGRGVNGTAYCTNCGNPLRAGDQFCARCGAPAPQTPPQPAQQPGAAAGQQPQPVQQAPAGQPFQPFPQRKKSGAGKIVGIVLAAIAATAVLAALLFAVVLPRFRGQSPETPTPVTTPAPAASSSQPEETPAPAALARYENDTVKFALEYPADLQLTEPNENNVLITDGEGEFQASVEYAWHTVGNSAIYDAADFVRQIDEDPQVLYDWLGTDAVTLVGNFGVDIAGTTGTEYEMALDVNGQLRTGVLVIFDGDSEFGCYTFLSLYSGKYVAQAATIQGSVEITGAYTYEDYDLYENAEAGWRYLLRKGAVDGKIEDEDDETTIYPVDRVYSECRVWLNKSNFSPEDDTVEEAMEASCNYYFRYHDNAAYTSRLSPVQYGRYPCWEQDLEYDGNMKLAQFLLEVDGVYWNLAMNASEDYYETGKAVVSDMILSLRFEEGAGAPKTTPTPKPTATPAPIPRTSAYSDQEWYLSLDDLKVVNIRVPAEWTADRVTVTDVSNQGNIIAGLRFSSAANADYGGHLVTIAVCQPGVLSDLPSGGTVFDLVLRDGSHYDVVWMGPTDVQYDYNDDAKSREYQALSEQVPLLLDGLFFYTGDW